MPRVGRFPGYLLSVLFVLLSTGALKFLHNLAHVQSPAIAAAQVCSAAQGGPSEPAPLTLENERDCLLHLMLGAPLLSQAGESAIVWEHASQWVLPPAQSEPPEGRIPARVDCRGPPSC